MRLPRRVQITIEAECQAFLDECPDEWKSTTDVATGTGRTVQSITRALYRLADTGACRVQIHEFVGNASRIRRQRLYSGHPVETGRGLAALFGMVAVQPVGARIVRGRSFTDAMPDPKHQGRPARQHAQHA